MVKMRLRPCVDLISLYVGKRSPLEKNEFHLHARIINVRAEQLRLLGRIAPPSHDLRGLQPHLELRKIGPGNGFKGVWRVHCILARAAHIDMLTDRQMGPNRWTGYVKICLTRDQVLRLLCIGGRCNLATVRSIQSTENSYDEPNPSHRAGRARASRHCGHGRFGARLPVGVAEEVIRNACAYELT
jgi:hypothetical protein